MKFLNIIFILILTLIFSTEAFSANYEKEYKKLVKRFPKAIKNKQSCLKYLENLDSFVGELNSRRHGIVDKIGYEHIADNKEIKTLFELRLKALRLYNFAELIRNNFYSNANTIEVNQSEYMKIEDVQLVKKEVDCKSKLIYKNSTDGIKIYEIVIPKANVKTYLAYNTKPSESARFSIKFNKGKGDQQRHPVFGFWIDCASVYGFCSIYNKALDYDFKRHEVTYEISNIKTCN